MILKKLMTEYGYNFMLGAILFYNPWLATPGIRAVFTTLMGIYVKPAFEFLGTVFDFKIIDWEKASQSEEYKEIVEKIRVLEEENKPLSEYDPNEIQKLRDEFSEKMDKVIKHPSSYT